MSLASYSIRLASITVKSKEQRDAHFQRWKTTGTSCSISFLWQHESNTMYCSHITWAHTTQKIKHLAAPRETFKNKLGKVLFVWSLWFRCLIVVTNDHTSLISLILAPALPMRLPHWLAGTASRRVIGGLGKLLFWLSTIRSYSECTTLAYYMLTR